MVLAVAVAIPLGILAAVGHRRAERHGDLGLSQLGIAIPAFWAGLMLITLVAVRWGWLPAGGFTPWGDGWWDAFRSLLLPAISLAIVQAAILTRYVRSAVLEVMREDYIRTARAKGLTRLAALRRHGLRNAAIPVVTVLGLQLTALLVGAVVVENVFTLPGPGQAAPRRHQQPRDHPRARHRDAARGRGPRGEPARRPAVPRHRSPPAERAGDEAAGSGPRPSSAASSSPSSW